jgi:hypothetical protein
MEYSFKINQENKSIVVVTTGDLDTKKAAAIGLKIRIKAKEMKYKIIFDHRLSKNRISIAEAYYWFSTHYDNIDCELRCIPTAYIANKENWCFYSFFECTCMNKGIPIKAFQDEKAALEWIESL